MAGCPPPASPRSQPAAVRHVSTSSPPFPSSTEDNDLPTDYQYTWSQEDYSRRRRTIDTWSFVLTLRARLWLLDQVGVWTGVLACLGVWVCALCSCCVLAAAAGPGGGCEG